jgi:hypothetical protein
MRRYRAVFPPAGAIAALMSAQDRRREVATHPDVSARSLAVRLRVSKHTIVHDRTLIKRAGKRHATNAA